MNAHRAMALAAAALALAAFVADRLPVAPTTAAIDDSPAFITAPALAERIMTHDPALRVFDIRSRADFDRFHVPGAAHATIRSLSRLADDAGATTAVVYGSSATHAARGWRQLRERGWRDVLVLRGGLYEWIARVHEPRLAATPTPAERSEFERAARLSRFFGGRTHEDVPRAEVPTGYWTGDEGEGSVKAMLLAVAAIRRRGC